MGAERVVVPAPTVDEPGSFDDFYRRAWPGAVRLAHLLTGVDAVAEDLAQESLTHRFMGTGSDIDAFADELVRLLVAYLRAPRAGATASG